MPTACVVCGDPVPTRGNYLDGSTTLGNMCERCNRDELRARGLDDLADRDARAETIARWGWRVVGIAAGALVLVILLGALLG
jgi:hypothetical protein